MDPEDARLLLRCVSIGAAVVITAIAASLAKAAVEFGPKRNEFATGPGPLVSRWHVVLAVLAIALAGAMVGVAFAIGTRSYRYF